MPFELPFDGQQKYEPFFFIFFCSTEKSYFSDKLALSGNILDGISQFSTLKRTFAQNQIHIQNQHKKLS
jgi:hypothetical protein